MGRKPISKKLRFDVFKRDGFRCQYCSATPSEEVLLEVDHIHPVAEGGTNDMDNLVTSCSRCNRGKGATPLTAIPQSLEDRAAEVAEREAQIKSYYKILQARKERRDDELWMVADMFTGAFRIAEMSRNDISSIRMFIDKLDVFEVMEAMEIALDRKNSQHAVFKYFCGICWNKIKKAHGRGNEE